MSDLKQIFAQDLRGAEYIAARGLTPKFLGERRHICENCEKAELLPTVLNILEGYRPQGEAS